MDGVHTSGAPSLRRATRPKDGFCRAGADRAKRDLLERRGRDGWDLIPVLNTNRIYAPGSHKRAVYRARFHLVAKHLKGEPIELILDGQIEIPALHRLLQLRPQPATPERSAGPITSLAGNGELHGGRDPFRGRRNAEFVRAQVPRLGAPCPGGAVLPRPRISAAHAPALQLVGIRRSESRPPPRGVVRPKALPTHDPPFLARAEIVPAPSEPPILQYSFERRVYGKAQRPSALQIDRSPSTARYTVIHRLVQGNGGLGGVPGHTLGGNETWPSCHAAPREPNPRWGVSAHRVPPLPRS